MAPGHLTHEELERMRMILLQHDQAEQTGRGIQSFDLNNPPKVPYRHQPFPTWMHHPGKRIQLAAANQSEKDALIAEGWIGGSLPTEVAQPELEPEAALEAAAVDAKLAKLRYAELRRAQQEKAEAAAAAAAE